MAGPAYRFDELGWAQFERLCDELLREHGLAGLAWEGRADELRVAAVPALPAELAGAPLPGPTFAASAWVRDWRSERSRGAAALRLRVALAAHPAFAECRSGCVLTNAEGLQGRELGNLRVVGPAELGALVDRHPALRRRVPSLLGVCTLAGLVDPAAEAASSWDGEAARALARVFVPTGAYLAALEVLERHRFAVLTGPPEMGKTAAARTLGLALQTEGFEVHECTRPEQVWRAFAPERAQLFIADDAFGSTEYRADAAERWALELERILAALDDRHLLVWTSRPAPLRAGLARVRREHGVERFPRPAEVQVDAALLGVEEKATMLFRHARAGGLGGAATRLVRAHGAEIVEHPHLTPERINRFVSRRLPALAAAGRPERGVAAAIAAEIAEPTAAMAASFDALHDEHRALLVALVDAPAGPVSERDIAASARRHAGAGLPRPPAELVDRLSDHFVRVVPPTSVTWVHPSWRDLVIERLAADGEARRRFLERSSLEGALLALSRAGGVRGERERPLLVSDGDFDALAQRLHELVPELGDPDLLRLLATLEDALTRAGGRDGAEIAAVATSALRSLAACWDRGQAYATTTTFARFGAVAALLAEPPAPARTPRFWAPPERTRPGEAAFIPSARGGGGLGAEREGSAIVARILADLAAAPEREGGAGARGEGR